MKPSFVAGVVNQNELHFLIADGHPIARSGLRKALHQRFKKASFSFATNSEETLGAARSGSFDAILLEVATPDRNGLRTLSKLHHQSPATPVLVVTLQSDEKLALPALAAGAAGFIGKSAPLATLGKAVERVMGGGIYLSEEVTRDLFSPCELEVFAQTVLARKQRTGIAARTAKADELSAGEGPL